MDNGPCHNDKAELELGFEARSAPGVVSLAAHGVALVMLPRNAKWAGAFRNLTLSIMSFATSTHGQGSAAKWADYCISAVRYNTAHTHIDYVRAAADNGTTLGPWQDYTRATVIAALKQGTTFVTVVRGHDGNFRKGQPVYIVVIRGVEYIKTRDNGRAEDNLEDLPEF